MDYKTEQISALFSGYPDVAAISRLDVSAKALSLYYAYNATTKKYDIPVVKSKDTYIKNVNMYALQYDPDSIPDTELISLKTQVYRLKTTIFTIFQSHT